MDFISVFDEASRDVEAEATERQHTAAVQDATTVAWPFLALAKSEGEFDHRLALVQDRLDALASEHGISCEDLIVPLRQGFQALLQSREAAGPDPKVAAERTAGYGLKATDVVGYTADADMHCVDCAHRLYGDDKGGSEPKQDGEGNDVHPIFASDEGWDDEHCGTCGQPLSEGRRVYSSRKEAGTRCAECNHSSTEHTRGAVCPTCGCTSFAARTASKTAAEQCDSTHPEGHRCVLPKGHMEDTSTHAEFTGYDGSTVRGGWHDGGEGTDYWRYGDEDPDNPKYKGTAYQKTSAAEVMAPGSVRVTHRPDKSGRFDVVQVWGPTSSQTIHQGYDSVEAHRVAQEAVEQARAGEGPSAVLYPSAPGHGNLDDKDRGPREYHEASFDEHIATLRQALMEGQDPLAWVPQSAASPAAAEIPSGHDTTQQFEGEPGAVIDKVTSRADAPFGGPR